MKREITLISTLPPIKGLSSYTLGLVTALSKTTDIDFIGFKNIYPDFLYPGGSIDKNALAPVLNKNVHLNNSLVWWNPVTWIKAGFSINTKVVHAQWWSWFLAPIFITILFISKIRDKKIIITIHNVRPHEKSFFKVFLNKSVLSLADEYIVHNQSNKELFLETSKTNKPVHVIPLGITEIEKSKSTKLKLRKKYRFNCTDKVILYFGNIREYKGLDVLINSLTYLIDNSIKLVITGKPWGSFKEYQKLIDKNNLNGRVKLFLEYVPESQVAELFKLSDVCVFPYKEFEASSAAASIALNFGKPIVVTDTGGLTETVSDPKVSAKPNDPRDLANKILYALSNRSKLSSGSRLICQKYLWKNIIINMQSLYTNIINS